MRDDAGDDLRPGHAGQGAGRPGRRHPRLHRLQPGLHRPLSPRVPRSRASSTRRPGASERYGVSAARRRARKVLVVGRRPGRHEGRRRRGRARPRRHALRGVRPGLGGQALLAQRLPGRAEFGGIVTNLSREIELAGVSGAAARHRVTCRPVQAHAPDLVVVATGARPYRPPLDVMDSPWIADAWEVIRRPQSAPAGKIVVADFRGDWTGLGTARLLAAAGHEVTLAVRGYAAGESLQQYVRDRLLAAISRQRITVLPLVRPYGADDDTVYLQHVLTEEPVLVEGVAGLVLACGSSPAASCSRRSSRRASPRSASATAWPRAPSRRPCSTAWSPPRTSDPGPRPARRPARNHGRPARNQGSRARWLWQRTGDRRTRQFPHPPHDDRSHLRHLSGIPHIDDPPRTSGLKIKLSCAFDVRFPLPSAHDKLIMAARAAPQARPCGNAPVIGGPLPQPSACRQFPQGRAQGRSQSAGAVGLDTRRGQAPGRHPRGSAPTRNRSGGAAASW